ncbi:MAG TPA: RDD family protein [Rhodocyclaceae bacterium]|nr:RDD family protein [Rhodocyclaceae bacterium]
MRIAVVIYESLLVVAVVFVASFAALPVVGDLHAPWQRHLFQVFVLGVLFVYFAAFWLRSGQTLAMKTWRVRLVRADGARVTPKQAVLRFGLALAGLALAGLGFWWALVDRDRQFLHDRLLGTRLIRVPRPA